MERDLKQFRVLVTPTTFGLYDKRLCQELEAAVGEVIYNQRGRPLASIELQELLPGCDGFIAGLDKVDGTALESADRLKVIARYGVGVDNVDLEAAARKKIVVTNTPHANAVSVAELTIGLLLSLARSIPEAAESVREGKWPRLHGRVLEGKVIGLIGFGSVGKAVARRLQPWQLTILACDPFGDKATAQSLDVRLVEMEELIHEADFVSLHTPLLAETRRMVNADFLSRMKRGACLINTARGELVDESALLEALDSGQLGGAALDVYEHEPPAAESPLRRHPRLIATPHCGAHTDGAADGMGRQSLRDCIAVLRGENPLHPVVRGAA
jgi:D-3-phosphoglycerate dehydrogenase / 2-oxoglutarate reductase